MGDGREGFDGFVSGSGTRLLRIAYLMTGSQVDAEDLLQDVLERVYVAWPRVHDPFRYTRSALARRAANRWRHRGRHPEVLMDAQMLVVAEVEDDRSRGSDVMAEVDVQRLLMAALAELPPHQRAVVVLRYFEDLSEAEAAAIMGCSVGAVKSQSSRALTRLRTVVEGRPSELGGAP